MATRTTNKQILSSASGGNQLSFKDIIVDLKPGPREEKVSKKLRLVGEPIMYMEYNARIKDYDDLDDNNKPTIKKKDFPDSDKRRSITRIGHDDESKCYWAKNGYMGSKKYAQNCIEYNSDGTFAVKILNKGATVFKPFAEWENGKVQEKMEDGVEGVTTFLGGPVAPGVRVTCHKDTKAQGGVRYEVNVLSVEKEITDEEIEALKSIHCPSDEEIAEYKAEYTARRAEDPRLPKFQEWFAYGHNIQNIFKYTPPLIDDLEEEDDELDDEKIKIDDEEEPPKKKAKVVAKSDDDDDEEEPVKPVKKAEKAKKSTKSEDDEDLKENPFKNLDDEDDDWDV